ncbi:MAG: nucleoside-diphosphate kinase [Candidatus Aminicenantes bacterium]|nr:nucleoside-diphosphate kinase [Candidatus Aminicenantes bacterium]
MAVEQTLTIIKPDGVARGLMGRVLEALETEGMKIVGMKMLQLTKRGAEGFYQVHRNKPFFDSLTSYMSSGLVVVAVLEGEGIIERLRRLMGATDPQKATPGTLRHRYGLSIQENVIHGSDSPETARWEIAYFFNQTEIHSRPLNSG